MFANTTLHLQLSRLESDLSEWSFLPTSPAWALRFAAGALGRLLAWQLRRNSAKVARITTALVETRALLPTEKDAAGQLDEGGELMRKLLTIHDMAKQQQAEMAGLAERIASLRSTTLPALTESVAVFGELAAVASELYWEIGEHDADHAPRTEGYTASTPAEVEAMLDRIMAGDPPV